VTLQLPQKLGTGWQLWQQNSHLQQAAGTKPRVLECQYHDGVAADFQAGGHCAAA